MKRKKILLVLIVFVLILTGCSNNNKKKGLVTSDMPNLDSLSIIQKFEEELINQSIEFEIIEKDPSFVNAVEGKGYIIFPEEYTVELYRLEKEHLINAKEKNKLYMELFDIEYSVVFNQDTALLIIQESTIDTSQIYKIFQDL